MYAATREKDRGQFCVFVDPVGKEFPALITEVWGPQCVNVVYVTDDAAQSDTYGLKLVRNTSCMHMNVQQAHGNFWYMPSAGETNKNLG